VTPSVATPSAVVAPEIRTAAPAVAAVAANDALTPANDAATREALRRKLDEGDPYPPAKTTAPITTPTVAPIVSTPPATAADVSTEQQRKKAEAEAKAIIDAEKKAAADAEKQRKKEEKQLARKGAPVAPIVPPGPLVESKFAKSKSQRLAELLEKYRRDEVTPTQYHDQRAKILAEP
jgi:hypothetical protein